jgi:hypothetical protein
MRILERIFLSFILLCATVVIIALTLATWFVQLVVSIADDPHAGPYRQVR